MCWSRTLCTFVTFELQPLLTLKLRKFCNLLAFMNKKYMDEDLYLSVTVSMFVSVCMCFCVSLCAFEH